MYYLYNDSLLCRHLHRVPLLRLVDEDAVGGAVAGFDKSEAATGLIHFHQDL